MNNLIEVIAQALDPIAFEFQAKAQNASDAQAWNGRVELARRSALNAICAAEKAGWVLLSPKYSKENTKKSPKKK